MGLSPARAETQSLKLQQKKPGNSENHGTGEHCAYNKPGNIGQMKTETKAFCYDAKTKAEQGTGRFDMENRASVTIATTEGKDTRKSGKGDDASLGATATVGQFGAEGNAHFSVNAGKPEAKVETKAGVVAAEGAITMASQLNISPVITAACAARPSQPGARTLRRGIKEPLWHNHGRKGWGHQRHKCRR